MPGGSLNVAAPEVTSTFGQGPPGRGAKAESECDHVKFIVKVLSIFVCALFFSFTQSPAQSNARVALGSNIALPGETVRILLELDAVEEKVSLVEGEVTFPLFLSFLGLEADAAVAASSIQLKAELLSERSPEGHSKLKATIQAGEGQSLPNGIVAVLTFRVAPDVKEETLCAGRNPCDVPLENNLSLTGPNGEMIPAEATSASITVMLSEPPIPSCFFYMH